MAAGRSNRPIKKRQANKDGCHHRTRHSACQTNARGRRTTRDRAGADRREFGRDLRHRLDHWLDAGAGSGVGHAAVVDLRARDGCGHPAGWFRCAALWPARDLYCGHRLRCGVRDTRNDRDPARLVCLVLRRDISRRPLWFGCAVLPFCRGRRRNAGVPTEGAVMGDGRRRVRRRARPAARAVDHGPLAAVFVCRELCRAGCRRLCCDGASRHRGCAEASCRGFRRRPAAARNRDQATLHRGSDMWRGQLLLDELRDDVSAARNEALRPVADRFQFWYPVAHRRDVRPELLYRRRDRAVGRANGCRDRLVTRGHSGCDRSVRHHDAAFLERADRARPRLEFRLCRCVHAGAGGASAVGEEQGPGLQ